MELFKLKEEECADGCPYYHKSAADINPHIHKCELQYLECNELRQIKENCPLNNIENLLEDFLKYLKGYNITFDDIMNFQLGSRIIFKFIEEEV